MVCILPMYIGYVSHKHGVINCRSWRKSPLWKYLCKKTCTLRLPQTECSLFIFLGSLTLVSVCATGRGLPICIAGELNFLLKWFSDGILPWSPPLSFPMRHCKQICSSSYVNHAGGGGDFSNKKFGLRISLRIK